LPFAYYAELHDFLSRRIDQIDQSLYVGQTFTSGSYSLKITHVSCTLFSSSSWRMPAATSDRVWLANTITTAIMSFSGTSNQFGQNIAGGWKWYGTLEQWPFNNIPYGLLYQIWADAIVHGQEKDCNALDSQISNLNGAVDWSYALNPSNV
jgi:hypothetical protein